MVNWSKENFKEKGLMQGDMALWMIFLGLCMISIVEVYSASSNMTYSNGAYWEPVMKHGSIVAFGICIAWVMHILPCKLYKLIGLVLVLASFALLIIAYFVGQKNGAARWIPLGPLTFQPSEVAKLGLIMFSAFIFSTFRTKDGVSTFGIRLAAVVILLILALIAPENLSTAGIIFIVLYLIGFYAQIPMRWLLSIGGVLAGGAILAFVAVYSIPDAVFEKWHQDNVPVLHRAQTWANRIKKGSDIPDDPHDFNITEDIQVTHAKIAVGTCGIFGKGPGNSVERDYLPHADNDFIYAIIIEEGGIIAGGFVMLLYLLLLYRSMVIARRCKALFPAYLIMGLALMMVIQAMVNMAVDVGAMPVTGQPLPLISRGGTSTIVNCAYMGIMLSVSRSARKIDEDNETATVEEKPTES